MVKTAADAIAEFLEEVAYVDKLHPESDPELLFYRRYRIAYYHRPDGMIPCPLCQQKRPNSSPAYIEEDQLKNHSRVRHPKATFKCGYNNTCTVLFNTKAEQEQHTLYAHTKPYGWWILG